MNDQVYVSARLHRVDWAEGFEARCYQADDKLWDGRPAAKKARAGDLIELDELPTYYAAARKGASKHFAQTWLTNSVLKLVSGDVFNEIQNLRLGNIRFKRVKLYEYDRTKTIRDDCYTFFICNVDNRFLADESKSIIKHPVLDWEEEIKFYASDNDICISESKNADVDIWIDSGLHSALFVSEKMYKALVRCGVNSLLHFKRCRVI